MSRYLRPLLNNNVLCKRVAASSSLPANTNNNTNNVVARAAANRRLIGTNAEHDLVVSILGPPNAGKSTLFNRLMCKESNRAYKLGSEKRKTRSNGRVGYRDPSKRTHGGAIVSHVAGTTRDRRECIGRLGGTYFRLVDTAGVDGDRIDNSMGRRNEGSMECAMIRQTMEAARMSDLVLLMFDARLGVSSDLLETIRWLRKISLRSSSSSSSSSSSPAGSVVVDSEDDDRPHYRRREIAILANKLEGDRWATSGAGGNGVLDSIAEVARAGLGEPIPISAEHGDGMAEIAVLVDRLAREKRARLGLPERADDNADEERRRRKGGGASSSSSEDSENVRPLQLAVLGRQNVGKSTLVNALLGEERVIAGEMPGLTRDAISVPWLWKGRPLQIVDTAGIRRGAKRERSNDCDIEDLAVLDAMRAMKLADVAVLVLDSTARVVQRQELAIADAVVREGRSLVIAANKMDLVVEGGYTSHDYASAVRDQIEMRFPMLRKTPVVAMSSINGEGVHKLMPVVFNARERWARVIPTGMLNRWLEEVLDEHSPPMQRGRPAKIKYILQTKGRPPTFLLFCNVTELPVSYLRYLTRSFQDSFDMFGMEVRLVVKKSASENPYASKASSTNKTTGIGGWQGRKKRLVAGLKKTGMPPGKDRQRSTQKKR